MKPSNFTYFPLDSVLQDGICESVAKNIMIILKRTGDKFRELTWEEYKTERLKDKDFGENEKPFFEKVIPYCQSAETAVKFCKIWAAVKENN